MAELPFSTAAGQALHYAVDLAQACSAWAEKGAELLLRCLLSLPFWIGVPVSSTRRRQLRLASAEVVLLPCALFSLPSNLKQKGQGRCEGTSLLEQQ